MNKVYVGNLSFNTTEAALTTEFSNFGQVTEAKIIIDRDTNRSKGFAFVTFETDTDAQKAIEGMDGQDFDGRPLRVSIAENKPRQPRGERGGYQRETRGGYGGGGGNRY